MKRWKIEIATAEPGCGQISLEFDFTIESAKLPSTEKILERAQGILETHNGIKPAVKLSKLYINQLQLTKANIKYVWEI